MRHDELFLWYLADPAVPRCVGQLRLVDAGKGVSLQYDAGWLARGFALSEDLPLVDIEHLPRWKGLAVGAVDDARPDRWGERVIQHLDKPARLSIMEYLFYAGDDRFGALGVSTSSEAYLPRSQSPLPRLEQAQQLSEVVHKVSDKQPVTDIERRMLTSGGSFGGAKPKALIDIAGEQWVIKFFNNEPIDVPLIEHASMTLAKLAGIEAAETRVVPLAGENALAVRRYDRDGARRIHCISAGTALRAQAVSGQEPELGYPGLAQLLRRAGVADDDLNLRDMHELFRRMVFNILIDNSDDHEKNHALVRGADGFYALSPAFDVLPAAQGLGYQQMRVGAQGHEASFSNALSEAAAFGLRADTGRSIVGQISQQVAQWKTVFQKLGVRPADIEGLAHYLDGARLSEQREWAVQGAN